MLERKFNHLLRCKIIYIPHNHEVAPAANDPAAYIWSNLRPNTGFYRYLINSNFNIR